MIKEASVSGLGCLNPALQSIDVDSAAVHARHGNICAAATWRLLLRDEERWREEESEKKVFVKGFRETKAARTWGRG